MNFRFYIANRYFRTNNRGNFVHIISLVSVFGVAIGTAALILVLSVFNGFEDLVLGMYNKFDPHLEISSKKGKIFVPDSVNNIILNFAEIENSAMVLEEKVLLRYQKKEYIATAKGVSSDYLQMTNFDSLIIGGDYINKFESNNVAVIGRGVAYYLSIGIGSIFEHLHVILPNRNSKTLLNTSTAFSQSSVMPVGVFGVQSEIDAQYIITPLLFMQDLSQRFNEVSSIEIRLHDESKMLEVQKKLQYALGKNYIIKNRLEQQDFIYKILNTEKLAVFLILMFIMIIATFNIVGSLSMLMLDKRKDISIMRTLGCTVDDIQSIFLSKSTLTILSGILFGLVFGLSFAFLQKHFGFIGIGEGSFVVDAYPISILLSDVLLVSAAVFIIGFLASWYPAKILSKQLFKK